MKKNSDTRRFGRDPISNGRIVPDGIDPRTSAARRFRFLVESLTNEAGGEDCLTLRQRLLVRQVASLQISLEHMEHQLVSEAEAYDPVAFAKVAGRLSRASRELFGSASVKQQTPASAKLAQLKRRHAELMSDV
jgi:hypothetical protein